MNKTAKILIVVALLAAVVLVITLKQGKSGTNAPDAELQPSANLPRLVDVGAGTCIPCKMMAPILEQLRSEYAGRLKVEFFDVREDPNVITEYDVMIIPTQILYDASGTELFRHEGFISKEDILAKFNELGVELTENK